MTLPGRRGHLHRAGRLKATKSAYLPVLTLPVEVGSPLICFYSQCSRFHGLWCVDGLVSWFLADSGSDGEQSTRAAPPPQDTRSMNVMDAYLMFLQRQERELSVNLRGRAARDYARGNLALVPSSFLGFFTFCFPSSTRGSPFLGSQFVSWTDNLLRICVSSCSVSRAVGWWLGCRRGKRSVVFREVPRRRSTRSSGGTGRSLLRGGGGTGRSGTGGGRSLLRGGGGGGGGTGTGTGGGRSLLTPCR
jgi:hypothetical protein